MAQAQQPQFSTRRVRIAPKPGYVLKTTTAAPGFYTPSSSAAAAAAAPGTPVSVPAGTKVFINVAYDRAVPSPQASVAGGAEMTEEYEDQYIQETLDGDPDSLYWVPIVVSDGRHDLDKAGKPSLVFDAVVNPSLKPRILRDVNYRTYLLEIILSQIEKPPDAAATAGVHAARRQLALSRTMTIPNIRAKGTLETREVDVPHFTGVIMTRTYEEALKFFEQKRKEEEGEKEAAERKKAEKRRSGGVATTAIVDEKEKEKEKERHDEKEGTGTTHRPRIEVLPDTSPVSKPPQPKSILKKPTTAPKRDEEEEEDPHVVTDADKKLQTPKCWWVYGGDPEAKTQTKTGTRQLIIELPNFTRADHARSALFVSRREEDGRRVITLRTSAHFLQVDVEGAGADGDDGVDALGRVRAEWRVRDECVAVYP